MRERLFGCVGRFRHLWSARGRSSGFGQFGRGLMLLMLVLPFLGGEERG